jgi:soluble lytic murein transglycosylase-like protein
MILIRDLPDAVERAPTLHGAETRVMDKIEEQWGDRCRAHSVQRQIPDGWLQAMIYRESGGKERAFRQEPNGWTGIGLFQITHPSLKLRKYDWKSERWVGGLTDEQVFDPETNIGIAAKYITGFIVIYGNNFPRVAAAFNAGSAKATDANPWGLVQTAGHVSAEVAALNYYLSTKTQSPPELISLVDLAREEDDAMRRETTPPDGAA